MDARAALPQNCSNARLSVSPKSENGTGVPDVGHESAMTGKLTAIVMFCAEARATNCSADKLSVESCLSDWHSIWPDLFRMFVTDDDSAGDVVSHS